MADDDLLTVRRLSKTYDADRGGVRHVDLDVRRGEVVGLLGPNGSGKSTTLHCLTGIIAAHSGSVEFTGIDHSRPEAKDVFGFLPDDLAVPAALRSDELRVMNRRLRPGFDDDLAGILITMVGLDQHSRKYLGDYSHGMKRKLQLCLALAHRPALLILDEPMRGLDPEAAVLVRRLITTFTRQGGGVLVATHDLDSAESNCARVVILSDGEVVASGSPQALARSAGVASLEEFFVRATGLEERIERISRAIDAIDFHPTAHRVLNNLDGGIEQ